MLPADKRSVVSYLYSLDLDHKGHVTFKQLMRYMSRAPLDQRRQSSDTRRSVDQKPSFRGSDAPSEWVLEDYYYKPHGRSYLLDKVTGLVYSLDEGQTWPVLVGKLREGKIYEQKRINPGDLFHRLDEFLKQKRVRLKDLFDSFDGNRDGELTINELAALIRQQMPEVSRAELLYFQAMMDVDGNGQVSYDELVKTAKQCLDASSKMGHNHLHPDVVKSLDKVSQKFITAPAAVKRAFDDADSKGTGSLDPNGLARFIKSLFPEMRQSDILHMLQYLSGMDMNGDGQLTYQELATCLHAVAPRVDGRQKINLGFTHEPSSASQGGRKQDDAFNTYRDGGKRHQARTQFTLQWTLVDFADER